MSRAGGNPWSREETSLIASLADRALRRGELRPTRGWPKARPAPRGTAVDRIRHRTHRGTHGAGAVVESAADSASLRGRSGSPCCFQLTHPDNWRGRSHSRQSSRNPNRKPASSVARGSRLGSRMRLTEVEPLGGRRCKAGGATRPELADAPRGRAEEPTERGRRPQAPSTDLSIQGPCASPGFADVRRLTQVLATILDRASPLRTRLADSCRRRHGRLEKKKRKEKKKGGLRRNSRTRLRCKGAPRNRRRLRGRNHSFTYSLLDEVRAKNGRRRER